MSNLPLENGQVVRAKHPKTGERLACVLVLLWPSEKKAKLSPLGREEQFWVPTGEIEAIIMNAPAPGAKNEVVF